MKTFEEITIGVKQSIRLTIGRIELDFHFDDYFI